MKLSSMFEFAFGKDINFGNEIKTLPYMTTLDFSKDVTGYGFAIRNGINADLSNITKILANISVPKQILKGIIEFKTEKSGNAPEKSTNITLLFGTVSHSLPELSSSLKEIVFWFPKESNENANKIYTVFREIELI